MVKAENGKYKVDTEKRIATLEANHEQLYKKVDEIANNHLQHLSADVADVKKSVEELKISFAKWTGGLAVAIMAVQLILKYAK